MTDFTRPQLRPVSPNFPPRLSDGNRRAAENPVGNIDLSPKERAVLALRLDYYTAKEIARQVGIAEGTVKTHLEHVRKKFGALSMGETYRRARLMGIA